MTRLAIAIMLAAGGRASAQELGGFLGDPQTEGAPRPTCGSGPAAGRASADRAVALSDRTDARANGVLLLSTGASAAVLTLAVHSFLD